MTGGAPKHPGKGAWAALLLGALVSAAPAGALADPAAELKEAQAALARGDYDGAYPRYLQAAEQQGNPLAQFTVAMFHRLGWGSLPENPEKACVWFQKAAAGDIPVAAHHLAACYEQGIGRPADTALAAHWYRKAAALGHHMSLCSLGDLHMQGRGVEQDPQQGLALCREAAQKGAVAAQVAVGRYLLEGDPRIRDPQAAHAWLVTAAPDSPEAQYHLGVIHRDGLGRPPSPAEARLWFERAASRGYVPAYFPTARLYFQASPDYRVRRPGAEELAKAYMWLSATARRSEDPEQLRQVRAMLDEVLAIMPPTWAPTLDERVATHLAEHPPSP